MDVIPAMFEFDLTDDLFQTFSHPCSQPYSPQEEEEICLLYPPQQEETHPLSSFNLPSPACTAQLVGKPNQPASGGHHRRRRRKASNGSDGMNDDDCHAETKKKKIEHRNIERQRRQEMTTLYASLRTQLPIEYLRGKRSISDHMYQAVNYIKHLQRNIRELSHKRDELVRDMTDYCPSNNNTGSDNYLEGSTVQDSLKITPCSTGIEVTMNTALTGGAPLSRVLGILMEEGFSIVSCLTTKVHERLLHSIKSEASDGRSVEPSELHQKLTKTLTRSHNGS